MAQLLVNPHIESRTPNPVSFAGQAWDAPRPLRLWHLTSLDAPTVAVVWALGFAWAAGVRLPLWVPVLLALVAWAVYVGDRLLDARAGLRSEALCRLRERHLFHWRHRRFLLPLSIAAACASACIVLLLMPFEARSRNALLAVVALAYFSSVHTSPKLPQPISRFLSTLLTKELLVGVLFTAGCVLPTLSRSRLVEPPGHSFGPLALPAIFFALLAWLNCHAIDRWESEASPQGGKMLTLVKGSRVSAAGPASQNFRHSRTPYASQTDSEPAVKGRSQPIRLSGEPVFSDNSSSIRPFAAATVLAFAGLLLAALLSAAQPRSAALMAAGAASALLLALLDRLRNRLTSLAVRAGADLVLLTPLLLAPFVHLLR